MARFRIFGAAAPVERECAVRCADSDKIWRAPEETPVAVVYNRRNYAVMLASPADLDDFTVGFSLTERIVDDVGEIGDVDIYLSERGAELHIGIAPDRLERLDIRQQRRNLVGRAGCGVCGLENAEVFFEPLPRVAETKTELSAKVLARALNALSAHQPLNRATRTVHAAAWADLDGRLLHVREDVGRHNALDKLLGCLARENFDSRNGFVLMSSRCSYELIEKSARLGVTALASLSGPTAFAIRKAREANLSLYCREGAGFVELDHNSNVDDVD